MKVKKQHVQLAGAALVLAVGWSLYSLSRPTARTAGPGAIPDMQQNQQIPTGRRGGAPTPPSTGPVTDPTTIPAPPALGTATLSLATRDPFLFGNEAREVRETPLEVIPDAPPPDPTLPIVKSILVSSTRRVALIENKMVAVGEKIGEFTVTQIDRDGVTFQLPSGERKKSGLRAAEPMPAGGVIK